MRQALAVAASFFGILATATTSVADAQLLTRTWVSGVGDDANPCTRTAPCQTFAGAIAKTEAGGEIDVLDPGSFGSVSITKAVTIDGKGAVASVLVTVGGGIFVNAGTTDVVILRNLEISGGGTGNNGVFFLGGKQLIIENCKIFGWSGVGIVVPVGFGATHNLAISNSTISTNKDTGIRTQVGVTTVSHSVIAGNGVGVFAEFDGVINADSNVLTANDVAVTAGNGGSGQAAATVRLSNNDVYGNLTGFGCGGGVLASNGTNRKGSNVGGTVPACAPNATITQQ